MRTLLLGLNRQINPRPFVQIKPIKTSIMRSTTILPLECFDLLNAFSLFFSFSLISIIYIVFICIYIYILFKMRRVKMCKIMTENYVSLA